MYLLTSVNLQLRPRVLKELRPGTRVVSHAFDMGDWTADVHEKVDGRDVYLWIVPADVDGSWNVSQGDRNFTLALKQQYQRLDGTATINGRSVPLRDAKLRGANIEFALDAGDGKLIQFRGTAAGNAISGQTTGAAAGPWRASRGS
jgi:hypothetical protein